MSNSKTIQYSTGFHSLSDLQQKIIDELKKGPKIRKNLVENLETPRTTIYDNLKTLKMLDLVETFRFNTGKRGHPLIYWKLKN